MNSETLADIVAEKRNRADEIERDVAEKMKRGEVISDQYAREVVADLRKEADRIEAAWKRELAKVEADALSAGGLLEAMRHKSGNAAAMRKALLKCREIAIQWEADEAAGVAGTTDKPESRSAAEAVIDMEFEINAALAAPPRNCDVGSPQEQADRHRDLCLKHGGCATCPRNKKQWSFKDCILEWEQEPYKGEG